VQHVLADSTADHQFAADRRRAYRDAFGVSGLRVKVKQPDSRGTPDFFALLNAASVFEVVSPTPSQVNHTTTPATSESRAVASRPARFVSTRHGA